MGYLFNALLLIALLGCTIDAKIIRCKRSSRRCGRNEQRAPAPHQAVDSSGVRWSPDGRTGNRYFEANGRYYVEVQELVPVPGGKYQIVRRVVETGQPPNAPHDQREPAGSSYPPGGEHSGSAHPARGEHPGSQYSQRDEPPSSAHSPDRGEPPSLEPTDQRAPHSYPHHGGGQPSHPQHYGQGDRETLPPIQYDETWYEPPGQTSYPRLLFSPHHGWREMNEDEVRRVRRIQPLAEYDPLLSRPVDRLPDQEGRGQPRVDTSDTREHRPHPHHPHDTRQPHPHHPHDTRQPHPHETSQQSEEEENPVVQHRTDSYGRVWTLRGGRWYPHDGSDIEIPKVEPTQAVLGEWVYRDGMWHPRDSHNRNEGRPAAPQQPSPTEPIRVAGWVLRDGVWHRDPQTQQPQDEGSDAYPQEGEGRNALPQGGEERNALPPGGEGRNAPPQYGQERAGDGWVLRDGIWYYEPQNQFETTTTTTPSTPESTGDGWILRDGTWYFEPPNIHVQKPYARIPGASHHDSNGQWEFYDGAWHFVTYVHGDRADEQNVQGHLTHVTDPDNMVNVMKVHVPDDRDHSQKLVEKVVKLETGAGGEGGNKDNDTSIDYRNWSYSYYELGGNNDGANAELFEADLAEASGQQPPERHVSPQYVDKDSFGPVAYPEAEEMETGRAHSSYFIRDGNVGAMVYTEGETEDSQRIAQASSDDGSAPSGPNLLSVDDYKRLQPSLSRLVPLQEGAAHLSCDQTSAPDGTGEFWLLQTTPCGEESPEGRILMPNGEILKFYGFPKLVKA